MARVLPAASRARRLASTLLAELVAPGAVSNIFPGLILPYVFCTAACIPQVPGRRLLHFDRLFLYELAILAVVILTYQDRPVDWTNLLDGLAHDLLAGAGA